MAGSLYHIVGEDGKFKMDSIENMGDAHEALEECFNIIYELSALNGKKGSIEAINPVLRSLKYPTIKTDMVKE